MSYDLYEAIADGDLDKADQIISSGENIYFVTENDKWTYLHQIADTDDVPVDSIRFLLEKGLDVNAIDSYGNTPLLYAVRQRNVEGIRLLLENGADKLIEHENLEGVSALRMGFDSMPLNYEVFDLLLQFGADPDVKKDGWKTARQMLTVIAGIPKSIQDLFAKY
ncbi:ankyrin repeat domain-containing protein [Photobacterium kishitanii]|uniref:Ankyrin repeat domain-containing protein n=2 Tax=Photobacterium kishitanii TaxID=318456 RepID=A0AAX0YPF8_9GAMM|nr:ankyrin repeat domain-containing protein [Photobacterium kishitanii]PSX15188.1 ankyrin repeat domain-containing protein [Photobacterium kishitanii]PSX21672.1 ankyrin repeat domain-containing protein [Photobacterium kishitanii]PSX25839.1 ankyrin repeat domain-containing protein [Photobacterium kishitanii]PSX38799.1 ankyrin repeat domain-containing protein [Photobacterium kishitanii]